MALSKALASSTILAKTRFPSISHSPSLPKFSCSSISHFSLKQQLHISPSVLSSNTRKSLCRAAEYQFPDPIPEFAEAETDKFKEYLLAKLEKKDIYGGSVKDVLGICVEVFSTFLHTEYGGPGTLLVVPFIDMADIINERGLPGGPQAARAAVVWAQKNVDKDWIEWNGGEN
ncbi:Protein PLASTID REDOX INSENSITIVE 2 [Ranunculus cassubicifolius]